MSLVYGLPVHMLNRNHSIVWLTGGAIRKGMALKIVSEYRGGCAIATHKGFVIAMVAPNGAVRELPPPFHMVTRADIANKPTALNCVCQSFWDEEVQGPWRSRGLDRHHPYCQFNKTAQTVYMNMAAKIVGAGGAGKVRPDEHLREEERVMGLRGEKTGERSG